jgi:hypothetical protein
MAAFLYGKLCSSSCKQEDCSVCNLFSPLGEPVEELVGLLPYTVNQLGQPQSTPWLHRQLRRSIHALNELLELPMDLRSLYGPGASSCTIPSRRRLFLSHSLCPVHAPAATTPASTALTPGDTLRFRVEPVGLFLTFEVPRLPVVGLIQQRLHGEVEEVAVPAGAVVQRAPAAAVARARPLERDGGGSCSLYATETRARRTMSKSACSCPEALARRGGARAVGKALALRLATRAKTPRRCTWKEPAVVEPAVHRHRRLRPRRRRVAPPSSPCASSTWAWSARRRTPCASRGAPRPAAARTGCSRR